MFSEYGGFPRQFLVALRSRRTLAPMLKMICYLGGASILPRYLYPCLSRYMLIGTTVQNFWRASSSLRTPAIRTFPAKGILNSLQWQ